MSNPKCKWHGNDVPVEDDYSCGCVNCGSMYAVKDCEGCGKTFLDWDFRVFDDIIAGPYVTSTGDLYCTRCGPSRQREIDRQEEEDAEYYPPDDAY